MTVLCHFLLLSLPFVMAWPLMPWTTTSAMVHARGPLTTNVREKVAGGGGVLLMRLDIRGPVCVYCCFVKDIGFYRNC